MYPGAIKVHNAMVPPLRRIRPRYSCEQCCEQGFTGLQVKAASNTSRCYARSQQKGLPDRPVGVKQPGLAAVQGELIVIHGPLRRQYFADPKENGTLPSAQVQYTTA
jgi:hypothetical protein